MFFNNLTSFNLQVLAFNSIKNTVHKPYATDIITSTTNMNQFCIQLLSEKTKHKFLFINKSDKIGLLISLVLQKPSGFIKIYIRKKRSADISVVFTDLKHQTIIQSFSYKHDCNELWLKALIFEYNYYIVSYIRNKCSNKLNDIISLISKVTHDKQLYLSVHVDIPNHIIII